MTEPYLIAHLVRGEPAFDIAEQMEVGDEVWWIIPTSGHRAYPYRHWSLDDLYDGSDMDMPKPMYVLEAVDPPEGLPDHYSHTAAPKGHGILSDLAARLGFTARPTITRR